MGRNKQIQPEALTMKKPTSRIDQILSHLETAAVDGGFKLSVKHGELVAEDLLAWNRPPEDPPKYRIQFTGTDISDVSVLGFPH